MSPSISPTQAGGLGSSRLRLGLGCAIQGNLYRERTDEEAFAVLEAAWDAGVRHYDTAPHYGLGLSEERLGRFLASKPREQYFLTTKAGRLLRPNTNWDGVQLDSQNFAVPATAVREWDLTPDGVRTSLEESLTRLGVDRVDVLYVHDPEASGLDAPVARGMESVARLRDDGLVDSVGVGSMSSSTLQAAAETGLADVLMVAGRYTLLDQGVLPSVLEACDASGTRIVAAAIFNSGVLAKAPTPGARYDYGDIPPDLLARALRIAYVCERHGVELATAAMHYPLLDARVDAIVVGAGSPTHILHASERMNATIPADLWSELADEGLVPSPSARGGDHSTGAAA